MRAVISPRDMDQAYANLNIAIWEQAIQDEIRIQSYRILTNLAHKQYPILYIYGIKQKNSYSKLEQLLSGESGALKFLQSIEASIQRELQPKGRLIKAIQWKIYNESQHWPNNDFKDKTFEATINQIKLDILREVTYDKAGN